MILVKSLAKDSSARYSSNYHGRVKWPRSTLSLWLTPNHLSSYFAVYPKNAKSFSCEVKPLIQQTSNDPLACHESSRSDRMIFFRSNFDTINDFASSLPLRQRPYPQELWIPLPRILGNCIHSSQIRASHWSGVTRLGPVRACVLVRLNCGSQNCGQDIIHT